MVSPPLVSVIIPCFNAEHWLGEAIASCLQQTYPALEIIVIDDGSTDGSLAVMRQYASQIRGISQAHQGGNVVRNQGLQLAQGKYVQYLDADDYLQPQKIEQQVLSLESTSADVAYGDWRYQTHADRALRLDPIQIAGPKPDMLYSLLANERWVPLVACLFRRTTIASLGWDETLPAAQDRDFLLRLALQDAQFVYQPGADSIYRHHGNTSVSRSCKLRWLQCHLRVMARAAQVLEQQERLSDHYRHALALAYYQMGKEYLYSDYPTLQETKFREYMQALSVGLQWCPGFRAGDRHWLYNSIQTFAGFRRAEWLAYRLKQLQLKILISPKLRLR